MKTILKLFLAHLTEGNSTNNIPPIRSICTLVIDLCLLLYLWNNSTDNGRNDTITDYCLEEVVIKKHFKAGADAETNPSIPFVQSNRAASVRK